MKNFLAILVLTLGFCAAAQADVWMWVDADGKTHFVDTNTPIYTWVDETGRIHYSDKPGHEDAVSVELVWVSSGSLQDVQEEDESGSGFAYPGETPVRDKGGRRQGERGLGTGNDSRGRLGRLLSKVANQPFTPF